MKEKMMNKGQRGLRGGVIRNPEQRQEQRRQILAAAGKVFARKGYAATTMEDIAAEMGVSKGILYYQFESKQDLIVETRQETSGNAATRLAEISGRPLPVRDRIELAIRDLIATNFDEFSRHVILTPVTSGLDQAHIEMVREIEQRYERLLMQLLDEGMTQGVFSRADLKVTAYTVIRTSMSPAWWFREDGSVSRQEVADTVANFLMRGLAA
ncbi:TetR/AcrR family transcriptional regulator [Hoeflea alexandrii]|nr:TetR/AcrR family transcriptional regulator [Hoeflea alexandrii]